MSQLGIEFFKNAQECKGISVNCTCKATLIFQSILLNFICSAVFIKKCTNTLCSSNVIYREVPFLPLNIDMIRIFGFSSLEGAICIGNGNNTCVSCECTVNSHYEFSNLILFDLNVTDDVSLKE